MQKTKGKKSSWWIWGLYSFISGFPCQSDGNILCKSLFDSSDLTFSGRDTMKKISHNLEYYNLYFQVIDYNKHNVINVRQIKIPWILMSTLHIMQISVIILSYTTVWREKLYCIDQELFNLFTIFCPASHRWIFIIVYTCHDIHL
jgi:hypothetical protein